MFAKGTALVLAPFVVTAYLLAWGRRRRLPWRPATMAFVVWVVAGGWWIGRLLRTGSVHVRGTVYPTDPTFTPEPLSWFQASFVPSLLETWWAAMVALGTPFAFPIVLLPAVALSVGVALALRRRTAPNQIDSAVALLPTLLLTGLILWAAYTTYARTGVPVGIQGRYLFPGVVGPESSSGGASGARRST